MIYDPESNIISIELSKGPISHAREFGNFIIHLSKSNKPILIEILDASKLVGQFDKLKASREFKQAMAIN
ncbi:DUF2283 domain-containing protein [Patescibacteria group bacterium]|nr:DUF2283 domain-containing protein [Candidatus Falkowbacteria bacterium]MBU3906234.1 DUF2283 domain-containing protein [Patescibacteria group bacterium]MBU4014576.1 DUF2283 domain-containing protein [Patescibacteria group bacterium]MBU4026863.1 DUF2283 domain-containing protein [Patescibacteria group bacterium]MBU4073427.1 DUF2283 domain-containing protein [Patescibacteria group bacterium]